MPHIDPLEPAEIHDPELLELIARCEQLAVPDALLPRILARVPIYAKALLRAMLLSHCEGKVDHKLKEIIRISLARTAGDQYFAGLRSAKATQQGLDEQKIEAGAGNFEDDPSFSPAEKCALRYAKLMYLEPSAVDAGFYAEMKKHFSEAQIMELGAFIAFHYGMQVFARTLDVVPPATVARRSSRT
jgi:alkylhydroperoxidase family enzyme